jgi:hypothetical protein
VQHRLLLFVIALVIVDLLDTALATGVLEFSDTLATLANARAMTALAAPTLHKFGPLLGHVLLSGLCTTTSFSRKRSITSSTWAAPPPSPEGG